MQIDRHSTDGIVCWIQICVVYETRIMCTQKCIKHARRLYETNYFSIMNVGSFTSFDKNTVCTCTYPWLTSRLYYTWIINSLPAAIMAAELFRKCANYSQIFRQTVYLFCVNIVLIVRVETDICNICYLLKLFVTFYLLQRMRQGGYDDNNPNLDVIKVYLYEAVSSSSVNIKIGINK